jgi:acyl-CoA synthetase (NDP forming)
MPIEIQVSNPVDLLAQGWIDIIVETKKQTQKPVVAILNAPECKPPPGKELLENAGISVFSVPERAAQALANALTHSR